MFFSSVSGEIESKKVDNNFAPFTFALAANNINNIYLTILFIIMYIVTTIQVNVFGVEFCFVMICQFICFSVLLYLEKTSPKEIVLVILIVLVSCICICPPILAFYYSITNDKGQLFGGAIFSCGLIIIIIFLYIYSKSTLFQKQTKQDNIFLSVIFLWIVFTIIIEILKYFTYTQECVIKDRKIFDITKSHRGKILNIERDRTLEKRILRERGRDNFLDIENTDTTDDEF